MENIVNILNDYQIFTLASYSLAIFRANVVASYYS